MRVILVSMMMMLVLKMLMIIIRYDIHIDDHDDHHRHHHIDDHQENTCEYKPSRDTEINSIYAKDDRLLLITGNLAIRSKIKKPDHVVMNILMVIMVMIVLIMIMTIGHVIMSVCCPRHPHW